MTEQEYQNELAALRKSVKVKEDHIAYLEGLTEMHTKVILMADEERKEAEKIIQVHESIHGIGKLMAQDLSSHDQPHLEQKEISATFNLSSLVKEGIDLDVVIKEMLEAFHFERSILFLKLGKKFVSKIFIGLNLEETRKPYFELSMHVLKEVLKDKKPILIEQKNIEADSGDVLLSLACIPLLQKDKLIGMLYIDKIH